MVYGSGSRGVWYIGIETSFIIMFMEYLVLSMYWIMRQYVGRGVW